MEIFLWVLLGIILLGIIVYAAVLFLQVRKEYKHANCEKGMNYSERRIAVLFDDVLKDDSNKLIINNLILPGIYDSKHTTQIDTLVICSKGIFVVETKSWAGKIYGNDNQKFWNVYYRYGDMAQFYNPVWQNLGHANRVKQIIQKKTHCHVDDIPLIPMVVFYEGDLFHVFSGNCFYPNDVSFYMQSLPDVLDENKVNILKELFMQYKEHPVCTIQEHTQYVREKYKNDEIDSFRFDL